MVQTDLEDVRSRRHAKTIRRFDRRRNCCLHSHTLKFPQDRYDHRKKGPPRKEAQAAVTQVLARACTCKVVQRTNAQVLTYIYVYISG